jgi:hypothetical protein
MTIALGDPFLASASLLRVAGGLAFMAGASVVLALISARRVNTPVWWAGRLPQGKRADFFRTSMENLSANRTYRWINSTFAKGFGIVGFICAVAALVTVAIALL